MKIIKEHKLGCLVMSIPLIIVINIIGVLMIKNDIKIVKSDFKKGLIKIDSISCNSISGSDGDNERCSGYGKVDGIITKVNLGNENIIDFSAKEYSVFYKTDGKITLLNKDHRSSLDKRKYLIKLMFIIILLGLIDVTVAVIFIKEKKKK